MKKCEIEKIRKDIVCVRRLCCCMNAIKKIGIGMLILLTVLSLKDTIPVIKELKNTKKLKKLFAGFIKT